MKLLFYPDRRIDKTRIGVAIRAIPWIEIGDKDNFDVCFYWNYKDVLDTDSVIRGWVADGRTVYNDNLTNVSKKAVDECFTWAFGYSSLVSDYYGGRCLSKANKQSRGDVRVVYQKDEKNINDGIYKYSDQYRIHQKIIDTANNGICVEYRAFIFGSDMFIVEKTKLERNRYKSNADGYRVVGASDIFSKGEMNNILLFCIASGLDFGEIDILRDKDGLIYIVDINNIAGGGGPWVLADNGRIFECYIYHLKEMLYADNCSTG